MTRQPLLLFIPVLALLALRLPAQATGGEPSAIRQATPAPDWQRVDTGPFSVALPPGWVYEPKQGVDSFVGELLGPDFRLWFDYGWYWNSRPPEGAAGYEVLREDLDYRPAELWVARADPAELTALYVDYVEDPEPEVPPTRLSLVGRDLNAGQQDLALAIMRSLRFRRVIPAEGRWEIVAELPHASLLDLELMGDGALRASGAAYDVGPGASAGAVFDLRDGVWQRQVFSGTLLIGGLDNDWAVEFGGRQVFRRDAGGTWRAALSDAPGLLFDLEALPTDLWVAGIRSLLHFDGSDWTQVPDQRGGITIDLVSKDAGWVASGTNLTQRSGDTWQAVPWPGPAGAGVLAVDTISPREAWFGGGPDSSQSGAMLHQRDGAWEYHADLTASTLWGVDFVSPAEGWAVGGRTNGPCEIIRFHEGTWRSYGKVCDGWLHDVQVAPDGTTWAVGFRVRTAEPYMGLVLRYAALPVTPTATATATPSPTATATGWPPRPSLYFPAAYRKR